MTEGAFTVLASTLTTALPVLSGGSSSTMSPLNRSGPLSGAWGDEASLGMCPSVDMPWSKVVFMLMYSVVGIVGLLGNSLVIYVVLRYSNMQTVTNMYILNLAIADECFLIGTPFLIATMNLSRWPFGTVMCKAYMVSTSITQLTSSIFLLVMSADRYIAICHHVSSPKYRTPMVSRIVSAVAWLTSALIMLPIICYSTTVEQVPGIYTCHILWPDDGHAGPVSFIWYSFTFGFAIPLCFIMLFYCLVIRKLRSLSQKTNKSANKRRSHRKVTKLVLTVITVYVLCWLPYWTSQMALIAHPESCSTRLSITIFLLVGCLGYSNSAINPILYAYLSDNFKKSFLKACVCAGTREVNAQLKVENSVLPRKGRTGRRLNSDFGTTTLVSSTVPGNGAKFKSHRTTLGTSGTATTTTTTSMSLLPSSIRIPSPSTTQPSLGIADTQASISHNQLGGWEADAGPAAPICDRDDELGLEEEDEVEELPHDNETGWGDRASCGRTVMSLIKI